MSHTTRPPQLNEKLSIHEKKIDNESCSTQKILQDGAIDFHF